MKLMVIDGNSIVNRAFYGVSQNLSTREGLPTNAIFGFVNILLKLLEEEQPEGLAVAFDLKAPTFRHLAYEGYKAQRKGMPEELAVQMPVLKRLLDAMNTVLSAAFFYQGHLIVKLQSARRSLHGSLISDCLCIFSGHTSAGSVPFLLQGDLDVRCLNTFINVLVFLHKHFFCVLLFHIAAQQGIHPGIIPLLQELKVFPHRIRC